MSRYNSPLTKELSPCPFCGGIPYIIQSGPPQGIVVRCGECSARTVSDHGQPAIDAWNRRVCAALAAPPAVGGEREVLIAALLDMEGKVPAYLFTVIREAARLLAPAASPLRGRETIKEATRAQHFDLPKGEPARFVRNGILETCQCMDCAALSASPPEQPAAVPVTGMEPTDHD